MLLLLQCMQFIDSTKTKIEYLTHQKHFVIVKCVNELKNKIANIYSIANANTNANSLMSVTKTSFQFLLMTQEREREKKKEEKE